MMPSVSPSASSTPTLLKRKLSIRWTLPICIIVPLLSGILLTNWLAFLNSQSAVEDLVGKISEEVAGNIEKQVSSYLVRPSLVSTSLQTAIKNGDIDPANIRQLGQTLWHFTQVDVFNNNLFYGNENGEFVYSEHHDGKHRLDFVDAESGFERIVYETDADGNPSNEIERRQYDPRGRTWYQAAATQGTPIWSDAYVATSNSALTITRATPIFDAAGTLTGIFGIDVDLVELSEFLRSLKISPNGRAFVMEPSGEIIAISVNEKPYLDQADEKLRLPANNSQDILIRETAQRWLNTMAQSESLDQQLVFEFDVEGKKQLAYLYPLQEMGVDWIIGVVIPQSDYMEAIHASARHTLLLGSLITGVASLLALLAALAIVRPINRLNRAAQDIKHNRYEPSSLAEVINRPDEFSELAELFNDMAMVVVSREQSLADQVDLLKSEIAQQGYRGSRYELEDLLHRARKARTRA